MGTATGSRGAPSTPRRLEPNEIEVELLALLRSRFDRPELEYADRPVWLADGVTARAFSLRLRGIEGPLSNPLVCRVFADGTDALASDQARVEEALHNALADLGYPVPRIFATGDRRSGIGAPFALMERVPGRNAFGVLGVALAAAAALAVAGVLAPLLLVLLGYWGLMARLLTRLHGLPGDVVRASLGRQGVSGRRLSLEEMLDRLAARIDASRLEGLRPALEWLRARRPAEPSRPVVCHGDFWLGNLMIAPRRVAVLDWTQACLAHPELDLGWMAIQHYSRLPLDLGRGEAAYDLAVAAVRPLAWMIFGLNGYAYRALRPVDPERLRYFTALNAVKVLTNVSELRLRVAGDGSSRPAELLAWGSPRTVDLVRRRVRSITGLDIELPPDPQSRSRASPSSQS